MSLCSCSAGSFERFYGVDSQSGYESLDCSHGEISVKKKTIQSTNVGNKNRIRIAIHDNSFEMVPFGTNTISNSENQTGQRK